jgi:hypothetical protein
MECGFTVGDESMKPRLLLPFASGLFDIGFIMHKVNLGAIFSDGANTIGCNTASRIHARAALLTERASAAVDSVKWGEGRCIDCRVILDMERRGEFSTVTSA